MQRKKRKDAQHTPVHDEGTTCPECHRRQVDGSEHFPDCRFFILDEETDDDELASLTTFPHTRASRLTCN